MIAQIATSIILSILMLASGMKLYYRIQGVVGEENKNGFFYYLKKFLYPFDNHKNSISNNETNTNSINFSSQTKSVDNNLPTYYDFEEGNENEFKSDLVGNSNEHSFSRQDYDEKINYVMNKNSYSDDNIRTISQSQQTNPLSPQSIHRSNLTDVTCVQSNSLVFRNHSASKIALKNTLNRLNLVMAVILSVVLIQAVLMILDYAFGYSKDSNNSVGPIYFYW